MEITEEEINQMLDRLDLIEGKQKIMKRTTKAKIAERIYQVILIFCLIASLYLLDLEFQNMGIL